MAQVTDPEVLKFIAETEAAYPSEANMATPEENRTYYDAMCAVFWAPHPEGVAVLDIEVGGIPVRQYRSKTSGKGAILYTHGGGFVVGSLDSHDDVCAELAAATGAEVWSSHYRLCPEHSYPAALDDVETVWRKLTADGRRAIVVGDSAGARLSAALCLRLRRVGGPMPLAQILIYPGLGGDKTLPSFVDNAEAPLLRTVDLAHYESLYKGDRQDEDNPELSPLRARDFANLPPAFVVTADVDPLRDEGPAYVEKLRSAGVEATWRNEPQLIHGYLRARHRSQRARDSFAAIIAAARAFLA
ncbi:alpha/beta hydrolase [Falsihalocynthiibacter arcticus]|uniref:Lipase n=1 Tax=Falsihalocynthiibacter arcticus TaxID=1579316 RepID=A0A126V2S6_9RHOB|nr:alpha/beta hydrolase [Falsihalocynthiibacter arcticus]AML52612.1 lipase [Falsihalocynthiibacter arcticus]